MPPPSTSQLNRMRTQANSHGTTALTVCTLEETNTPLGVTVVPTEEATYNGLLYSKLVAQQLMPGAMVHVVEDHATLPATATVAMGQALKHVSTGAYYKIVNIATVDDGLLILQDLTLKRVTI